MPHITSFLNFANVVFREFYETNKKVHFAVFDMILLQLQNADYLYTFSQNMSVVLDSVFWGISLLNELKLKILVPEYRQLQQELLLFVRVLKTSTAKFL